MIHDSTWLARTRITRWMRLTTAVGFLLACMLLAGLPAAASATTTEMRGEWGLTVTTAQGHVKGTALIIQEANAKGEFASSSTVFESVLHGTFSGTLEGSKATVIVTTEAYGPVLASKFTSSAMTVESSGGSLSMSGEGTLTAGTETVSATLAATRIRTYKQIEEQEAKEAKEKQEREERELSENIRGEWSLTLKVGPQTSQGTALVIAEANAKKEFTSSSALFEAVVPGAFSGTLEGSKATVTVATQAYGPVPAGTFTSNTMEIVSSGHSLSMSGEGTLTTGGIALPGATLTATRTKTYKEVTEQQAKEKLEQEAKETLEREAKVRLEREAKEKVEREAKEKLEREAREAAEKAAIGKSGQVGGNGNTLTLVSVELAGKAFTVGASELVSLQVTNPNAYAVEGRITLLMTQTGKAGKASTTTGSATSKKTVSLGTASFGISPTGEELVKVKLSKVGRHELTRHTALHVIATITTRASGQTSMIKTFTLTLHAAKPTRSKH
jgi:hypothetical protein